MSWGTLLLSNCLLPVRLHPAASLVETPKLRNSAASLPPARLRPFSAVAAQDLNLDEGSETPELLGLVVSPLLSGACTALVSPAVPC